MKGNTILTEWNSGAVIISSYWSSNILNLALKPFVCVHTQTTRIPCTTFILNADL